VLAAALLGQRTAGRRVAAWTFAIAAPGIVAVALEPFRVSFGLAGFLIWALLAVVGSALLGGLRPAFLALTAGFLAALYVYAPPYDSFAADLHPNLVALVAFVAVGLATGFLVDEITRSALEQAALRRVATLVAYAVPAESLFASVTEEVGRLLGTAATGLLRYGPDGTAAAVGSWSAEGVPVPTGTTVQLDDASLAGLVASRGGAVRMDGMLEPSGRFVAAAAPARRRRSRAGVRTGVGTPVVVSDRPWGAMLAFSKAGRRLGRDTEARLVHFTDLVAMAVGNAESHLELAASRARVVAAGDAARRRIERDLHDGAQQRLVSLGLELRNVEAAVPDDLADVRALLGAAARGLAEVTSELQELSRGIHPAILSKGGLTPAIKGLARRYAVPVELDLPAVGRLADPIEAAAYFVASEALANAVKHARASVVRVGLRIDDRRLVLSVSDDGVGGADPERGSGLIGLKDRVESLGGRIEVDSRLAVGTSLVATLPFTPR
jgi:signal transduction histidine kinase